MFAAGALGAVLAVGAVLLLRGPAEKALDQLDFAGEGAAVTCSGSVVELEFDPAGRIEARTEGEKVAEAGTHSDHLNDDDCAKTPPPHAFSQAGVRYTRIEDPTTVTCRFPGRFLVHVYPVSPSWAGERPGGRAIGLVLERRIGRAPGPPRVILASASILDRHEESNVVFVRKYCTPSSG